MDEMNKELRKFSNQERFIREIIEGKLVVARKKKTALIAELKARDYSTLSDVADAVKEENLEPFLENDEESEAEGDIKSNGYDYLLGMPLWSLTQERIEKLKRQVEEKEAELEALIKLKPTDLWNNDLDEFVAEWHTQLQEEADRLKSISRIGRRASQKLKMAGRGAGKKRKGADLSDEEFEVKTKKITKTVASKLPPKVNYVAQKSSLMANLGVQPKAKALTNGLKPGQKQIDGTEDDVKMEDAEIVPPVKAKPQSNGVKASQVDSTDEDEDVVVRNISRGPTSRAVRAAASKPVKYTTGLTDSEDDGDDLLGDVSQMVKGIGSGSAKPTENSRTLFSASMSRPGSSSGLTKSKPAEITEPSDDEEDYAKLSPPAALPKAAAPKPLSKTLFDEDGDDSLLSLDEKPKPKQNKTVMKKSTSAAAPAAPKGKAAAAKKAPVVKAAAPAKKAPLSPAAKAYAAKQAKAAKKKVIESDDDEIDGIANDILDSPGAGDSDIEMSSPPPRAATAARPARRAATTTKKSNYVVDDLSDELESEDAEVSETYSDFD